MKLASFMARGEPYTRVGALIEAQRAEYLVDLTLAYTGYLREVKGDPFAAEIARVRLPSDMVRLLEGGEMSLEAATETLQYVAAKLGTPAGAAQMESAGILHRTDAVRYLPPVPRPGKIVSVGLNYQAHVAEAGNRPQKPAAQPAFGKFSSTLVGHREPVVYSRRTKQLDYELELCIVIGKRCKDVAAEKYLDPIAGFTIFNDISMRDIQHQELQNRLLCLGKNMDTAGPLGPYLVTKDEIADPQNLQMKLRVNGEERQNENTRNMIFNLAEIMEYWSLMTLEPGDVITTGSPAGVAIHRDPPERYLLKPGDVVEGEIEHLGVLINPIVAEE